MTGRYSTPRFFKAPCDLKWRAVGVNYSDLQPAFEKVVSGEIDFLEVKLCSNQVVKLKPLDRERRYEKSYFVRLNRPSFDGNASLCPIGS